MKSRNSKWKDDFCYEIFAVHKLKFPERCYFDLHNLFESSKSSTSSLIYSLLNEKGFKDVWNNSHAWKSIELLFKRP